MQQFCVDKHVLNAIGEKRAFVISFFLILRVCFLFCFKSVWSSLPRSSSHRVYAFKYLHKCTRTNVKFYYRFLSTKYSLEINSSFFSLFLSPSLPVKMQHVSRYVHIKNVHISFFFPLKSMVFMGYLFNSVCQIKSNSEVFRLASIQSTQTLDNFRTKHTLCVALQWNRENMKFRYPRKR